MTVLVSTLIRATRVTFVFLDVGAVVSAVAVQ